MPAETPDPEERSYPVEKEKVIRQLLGDEEGNGEAVEGVPGKKENEESDS